MEKSGGRENGGKQQQLNRNRKGRCNSSLRSFSGSLVGAIFPWYFYTLYNYYYYSFYGNIIAIHLSPEYSPPTFPVAHRTGCRHIVSPWVTESTIHAPQTSRKFPQRLEGDTEMTILVSSSGTAGIPLHVHRKVTHTSQPLIEYASQNLQYILQEDCRP